MIALALFLVLFAIAIVWAALWYNLRQEKQVRTDTEDDEEGEQFVLRPGEGSEEEKAEEEEGEEGEGEEGEGKGEGSGKEDGDGERLEPGTLRYRRA